MSLRKNGYDVRNKFQDCKTSYQDIGIVRFIGRGSNGHWEIIDD